MLQGNGADGWSDSIKQMRGTGLSACSGHQLWAATRPFYPQGTERQEGSMDSRQVGGRCGGRRERKISSSCSSSLSETEGEMRVRCWKPEDRGEHMTWFSRILPAKASSPNQQLQLNHVAAQEKCRTSGAFSVLRMKESGSAFLKRSTRLSQGEIESWGE